MLNFNAETEKYTARVLELAIESEGASRADALLAAEAAVEARVSEVAQSGETLAPLAEPLAPVEAVTFALNPILRQDLAAQAARHGLTEEALATQLLAQGLGWLEGLSRVSVSVQAQPERSRASSERARAATESAAESRGPQRRKRREGYHGDLENKANFMDYVRNLERGGGGGRNRGR
ncbi:MAG: hypothetical protein H6729_04780 [Deltaproteobacteria bacterium]|nr:hypothetical protein [Deltaproteobacteria bacterium]